MKRRVDQSQPRKEYDTFASDFTDFSNIQHILDQIRGCRNQRVGVFLILDVPFEMQPLFGVLHLHSIDAHNVHVNELRDVDGSMIARFTAADVQQLRIELQQEKNNPDARPFYSKVRLYMKGS